jgi:ATP-binding cassette, subfamily F, member 3
MLEFFRNVSATIPTSPIEPTDESLEQNSASGMLQDRAGIIVLREDLDFYVIPPFKDISYEQMIEVKRAASKQLLKQNGIFSGLKRSDDAGTTEQHLIEMLTAGYNSLPFPILYANGY